MHSNFSFYVYQLPAGAGLGLTRDQNRARMRGPKQASPFFSAKHTEKIAHACAVLPDKTQETPPLASRIGKNTKRTTPVRLEKGLPRTSDFDPKIWDRIRAKTISTFSFKNEG